MTALLEYLTAVLEYIYFALCICKIAEASSYCFVILNSPATTSVASIVATLVKLLTKLLTTMEPSAYNFIWRSLLQKMNTIVLNHGNTITNLQS